MPSCVSSQSTNGLSTSGRTITYKSASRRKPVERGASMVRKSISQPLDMRRVVTAIAVHNTVPAEHGEVLGVRVRGLHSNRQVEYHRRRGNEPFRQRLALRAHGPVIKPSLGDDDQRENAKKAASTARLPPGTPRRNRRPRQGTRWRQARRAQERGCFEPGKMEQQPIGSVLQRGTHAGPRRLWPEGEQPHDDRANQIEEDGVRPWTVMLAAFAGHEQPSQSAPSATIAKPGNNELS
jgi:hypothetical protein